MKLILISGKAGSGKDTAANMMKEQLTSMGHTAVITHFADPLKYACKTYFGWDGSKDEAGRSLLQHVGTDIVRKKDQDFWVDFVEKMLEFFSDELDCAIIPDTRFPNEVENFRRDGFDVVHIEMARDKCGSTLTIEQQFHESETALRYTVPDYFLVNDEGLEELRNKVNYLLEEKIYGK